MPKKTRKEKIIAEYRKRLRLLQSNQNTIQYTPSTPEPASSPEKTEKKQPIMETEEDSLITSYFKKDFKKSLFLIAIVITLEISLYFVRIIK